MTIGKLKPTLLQLFSHLKHKQKIMDNLTKIIVFEIFGISFLWGSFDKNFFYHIKYNVN